MSFLEQEFLTDKQYDAYKDILKHQLKMGRLLAFTAISLPLLFIVTTMLLKSFILSGEVLSDLEPSNALISNILGFTLNNYLILLIIPVIYGVFTFTRAYRQVKDCKKDLLLLDLMMQEKVAVLSGQVFDPLADLYKKREEHNNLYGGRTLPFLFTGKAFDFIFSMLSVGILLSILGQGFYLRLDNGIWACFAFIALCLFLIALLFLIVFYIYTAIKGVAVALSKDKTLNYPPARLNFFNLIIFSMLMLLNVAVISQGYELIQRQSLDTLSLTQLCAAVIALITGFCGISLLIKEHFNWRSSQKN